MKKIVWIVFFVVGALVGLWIVKSFKAINEVNRQNREQTRSAEESALKNAQLAVALQEDKESLVKDLKILTDSNQLLQQEIEKIKKIKPVTPKVVINAKTDFQPTANPPKDSTACAVKSDERLKVAVVGAVLETANQASVFAGTASVYADKPERKIFEAPFSLANTRVSTTLPEVSTKDYLWRVGPAVGIDGAAIDYGLAIVRTLGNRAEVTGTLTYSSYKGVRVGLGLPIGW